MTHRARFAKALSNLKDNVTSTAMPHGQKKTLLDEGDEHSERGVLVEVCEKNKKNKVIIGS